MNVFPGVRPARSTPYLLARQSISARRRNVCGILALLLLVAAIVSAAHGPANIPYGDVARLVLRGMGIQTGLELSQSDYVIVTVIRLPRILIGALVGAALACAGATMQGIFRNPLADPGLLGVGAGGGLGAVLAITTGLAGMSLWVLPIAAFIGAMGTAFVVYSLSMVRGRSDTTSLLLAGMAISALLGALTTIVILFARDYYAVQSALSWLFGGLHGRGWDYFTVAVIPIVVSLFATFLYSRELNLLLTGEEAAQALGVNVPRSRFILLTISSLLTGAAVSIAGGISFVGLMVPHALRLIVGPDYRVLLPASALGGALFLVVVDTISRLILQPEEIQVGILTALLGAPFFLLLLWQRRQAITL